jgi:manganese-dependent inorganic pyrophosphatase
LARKTEILEAMRTIKSEEWYDFILFCIVDILNEKNTTLIASEVEAQIVQEVFWAETLDGQADLGDRISRKKTIVPQLEENLL